MRRFQVCWYQQLYAVFCVYDIQLSFAATLAFVLRRQSFSHRFCLLTPRHCERMALPYTIQFEENDRAILEGQTEGFVKIHVKRGTDKILGATIVGDGAGDMIRCVLYV